MKTKILVCLIFAVLSSQANAQITKSFSKLKDKINSGIDNVLGDSPDKSNLEDPACACNDAVTVFQFGDKYKINYRETQICMTSDGKILLQNNENNSEPKYYISEKGVISGPFNQDNPKIKQFNCFESDGLVEGSPYISKEGDNMVIKFGGKTYGPYAHIQDFVVSGSKNKFAAFVIKDSMTPGMTEEEAEKLENASQAEQMAYAMKMQEQLQQRLMSGGELDMMPKLVTNIEGAEWDVMSGMQLSGKIKFDDICLVQPDKITDLSGKILFKFGNNIQYYGDNFWLSRDNSRYAWFDYGTLAFSDGEKLEEISNPAIIKEGNAEFITYTFYSPKDDAIKMCKIQF